MKKYINMLLSTSIVTSSLFSMESPLNDFQSHIIQKLNDNIKIEYNILRGHCLEDFSFALPVARRSINDSDNPNMLACLALLWETGNSEDKRTVRDLLTNTGDPRIADVACVLYTTNPMGEEVTTAERESAHVILQGVIKDQSTLDLLHVAKALYSGGSLEDKDLALPVLVKALQDPDIDIAFQAALLLWHNETAEDKMLARPLLVNALQDLNTDIAFQAALLLWHNETAEDKDFARPLLVNALQNPNLKIVIQAAEVLWLHGTDGDKDFIHSFLATALQNSDHNISSQAESALWSLWHRETAEVKAFVSSILVKGLEASNVGIAIRSALLLWQCETAENKDLARSFFVTGLQKPDRNISSQAKSTLWNLWRSETAKHKELARSIYLNLLESPNADIAFDAARELLIRGTAEDKLASCQLLRDIAHDQANQRSFSATHLLWNLGNAAYQGDVRDILRTIANTLDNPKQKEAIDMLWDSGNAAYRGDVRDILRTIANTLDHPEQQNAIIKLRESNDPEDQRIGLELQELYFPVVLLPETENLKAQFNLSSIRAAMPKPLTNLSEDAMDIVKEMDDLISSINLTDESNPYYLTPTAITETVYTIQEIKNHTLGFLKTLTGQTLLEGETPGWQMYEDNKPDMINSFKHLIHAIKAERKVDPQSAMVRLGIILNGILHCPTGQAEAMQSAINALVHQNEKASSDVSEEVGMYIFASAVEKAFNNAFHGGGGVHGIARARMALATELGMHHAIGSFRERISPVALSEIPNFYNQFYGQFNLSFILAEARRNIQTAEEYNQTLRTSREFDLQKAKRIKMEKPISVGQIVQWLSGDGETENLHTLYGISEDYSSISDGGLINTFIKMGYLNADSALVQEMLNNNLP